MSSDRPPSDLKEQRSFWRERSLKRRVLNLRLLSHAQERLKISREILNESAHALAVLRIGPGAPPPRQRTG
jgi:hypothetical protein